MGLSSNQARFLSLTARQIDLEHRVQQICQRRLRLSNDLQRAANAYNDQTSDRRLYVNTINNTQAGTTSGVYNWINLSDLADNNLYILGATGVAGATTTTTQSWVNIGSGQSNSATPNPGAHVVGVPVPQGGTPPVQWTYTGYSTTLVTPAVLGGLQLQQIPQVTDLTEVPSNGGDDATVASIVNTSNGNLSFVTHETYTRQADGTYEAETIRSVAIYNQAGFDLLTDMWEMGTNQGMTTNYILMSDITLPTSDWHPIGTWNTGYAGTFDGNGHTISGLTISGAGDHSGFFSKTNGATIKNLDLVGVSINGIGNANTGGLIGGAFNTTITNCSVSGAVSGEKQIGGLVGAISSSTIDGCGASVAVTGAGAAGSIGALGGLVGWNQDTDIFKSYASGNVTGAEQTGGLVGYNTNNSSITNCYAIGNVITVSGCNPGTLVGENSVSTINTSYGSGIITIGGSNPSNQVLVGEMINEIVDIYSFSRSTEGGTKPPGVTDTWDQDVWVFNNEANYNASGPHNSFLDPVLAQNMIEVDVPNSPAVYNYTWSYIIEEQQTTTTVTYNFGTGSLTPEEIEAGLRDGSLQMVTEATPFTQEIITGPAGSTYEAVDWRTQPVVSDDLYKVNDEEAQYQYEKITREVNTQDKKLQLEQTSVEAEYNAVRSEKEAVEKVIDTNAKSSFKYFS